MTGAGGNSVANKFKYNGVELEESLGLNLYEMDVRSYDPAIARFTSIDPVTHHSMSTFTAFDNNPVFWADPSGADAVYNWDDGKYYDEGKEVSFDQALASHGLNSNGSEKPIDDKRVDSKTGKVTITKTDAAIDRLFVDGKFVETAEQGSLEKELIDNGTEFSYTNGPVAAGMGLTDFALTWFSGEAIFAGLGKLGQSIWGVRAAARTKQVVATIEKVNPFSLEMTHGLTLTKRQFQLLKNNIAEEGIKDAIPYVQHNGVKYLVGGHHRVRIAKELGIKAVPVKQVSLPYANYKTTADLIITR